MRSFHLEQRPGMWKVSTRGCCHFEVPAVEPYGFRSRRDFGVVPSHSINKAREDSACQYRVQMWVSVCVFFFFFNIFLIGGKLFYNVVLVSAIQQQSQPLSYIYQLPLEPSSLPPHRCGFLDPQLPFLLVHQRETFVGS